MLIIFVIATPTPIPTLIECLIFLFSTEQAPKILGDATDLNWVQLSARVRVQENARGGFALQSVSIGVELDESFPRIFDHRIRTQERPNLARPLAR